MVAVQWLAPSPRNQTVRVRSPLLTAWSFGDNNTNPSNISSDANGIIVTICRDYLNDVVVSTGFILQKSESSNHLKFAKISGNLWLGIALARILGDPCNKKSNA